MVGRCLHLLAALAAATSASALAVELTYRWQPGDTHRFVYSDETSLARGVAKVVTRFSEKVLSVSTDGTADIELSLERVELSGGGAKRAILSKLPAPARTLRALVDPKGHARFTNTVAVFVQDGQLYLGVQASAGARDVSVLVAVDPKTAKVVASTAKIREGAQRLEVIPLQVFQMMVLPNEDLAEGGRAVRTTRFGDIASTLESAKPTAKVRLEMSPSVNPPEGDAAEEDDDSEEEEDDSDEVAADSDAPPMNLDASYEFDVLRGRLLAINGHAGATKFSLKRMPLQR